jgi:D-glycero-alpha-D-manno-heptose-7-phosphate kinase
MLSAKKILQRQAIKASAPCRIDSGGTWDIKALALPLQRIEPVTLNMALNLRTRVSLSPFKTGWVSVSSEGFSLGEEYPYDTVPFNSPFGLFFAATSHFGFHGLKVHISSDSPVKSALGGSSTALIALLRALSKLSVAVGGKKCSGREILHMGYHLEDGVSGGNCGIQDQAAAVFGGVNRWTWWCGDRGSPFKREPLLDIKGQKELSKRILVAFSGKSHASLRINRNWINDFLSSATRSGWVRVNELVNLLANAIKTKDWDKAARFLRKEMVIRQEITPDALIPITEELVNQAEKAGCGARFTGAGGGGTVWALGEKDRIRNLGMIWERTLAPIRGGRILECAIDPKGVREEG